MISQGLVIPVKSWPKLYIPSTLNTDYLLGHTQSIVSAVMYLMYRLICQKPAHFLSAQMALVSTFFQMCIVLGMYNFGADTKYYSLKPTYELF